jgi:hypothetical protein
VGKGNHDSQKLFGKRGMITLAIRHMKNKGGILFILQIRRPLNG